jgi:superfamily II RNA helicase
MKFGGHDSAGLRIGLDLPDPWQHQAVRFLQEGASVVLDAPTGAGKTRVFELFVKTAEARHLGQIVYTVPTRALANDKWREWTALGWNVGIATGDIAENLNATILVATLETQRERLLAGRAPDFLVLDEYQMLGDPVRGLNYEMAIALAPPTTQLLLLSGSVGNPG